MIVATASSGGWVGAVVVIPIIVFLLWRMTTNLKAREQRARAISRGQGPPVIVKKVLGRRQQEAEIARMLAAGYRLQGQSSASTFLGLGSTETVLTFIRDPARR